MQGDAEGGCRCVQGDSSGRGEESCGHGGGCRVPGTGAGGGRLGVWRGRGGQGLEEAAGSAVCGHGVVSDTASATSARPTWCVWDNGGAAPPHDVTQMRWPRPVLFYRDLAVTVGGSI